MKPIGEDGEVGSVVTLKELSNEKFVISQVVRGGMGEVYQLVPVASYATALALKTYQKDASREQFIREAGIWISLGDHPYIARAFCYLEWQTKPSIISSWYGQPATVETANTWTAKQLVDFTVHLIAALQYAHSVGHVLHQDIKPANILLDEHDEEFETMMVPFWPKIHPNLTWPFPVNLSTDRQLAALESRWKRISTQGS